MFTFTLDEMSQISSCLDYLSQPSAQTLMILSDEMADDIACKILSEMSDDADISQFVSFAMWQIARKIAEQSEKMNEKAPTAQELIDYSGAFSPIEGDDDKRKNVITKLANSRYELSDFADIKFREGNPQKVESIVIAAAHKGKILHVEIWSYDTDFENILKKCKKTDVQADTSPSLQYRSCKK